MIFLCGLFVPIQDLPGFLNPLAYILPLTYGADILQSLISLEGHLGMIEGFLILLEYCIVLFEFSILKDGTLVLKQLIIPSLFFLN